MELKKEKERENKALIGVKLTLFFIISAPILLTKTAKLGDEVYNEGLISNTYEEKDFLIKRNKDLEELVVSKTGVDLVMENSFLMVENIDNLVELSPLEFGEKLKKDLNKPIDNYVSRKSDSFYDYRSGYSENIFYHTDNAFFSMAYNPDKETYMFKNITLTNLTENDVKMVEKNGKEVKKTEKGEELLSISETKEGQYSLSYKYDQIDDITKVLYDISEQGKNYTVYSLISFLTIIFSSFFMYLTYCAGNQHMSSINPIRRKEASSLSIMLRFKFFNIKERKKNKQKFLKTELEMKKRKQLLKAQTVPVKKEESIKIENK